MSDKISFAIIVSEGVHDVMSILKVLSLKGFREITSYRDIPEALAKNMIPTKYPWADEGDRLTWSMPHPSFLQQNGHYIVVSNAGGKDKLGTTLNALLATARREELDALRSIAIVTDADLSGLNDVADDILKQLTDAFAEQREFTMEDFCTGQISVWDRTIPSLFYVFPDHRHTGTLEKLLLEGAEVSYPDLLSDASAYVDGAKAQYGKYLEGFHADKAVVGVITNILKPGRPNQASIRDNNWFTGESLTKLPLHQKFSTFIDEFLRCFD